MPLLDVDDLHTAFRTRFGTVRAVNGLSFSIEQDETVAIVGESGSGKSVMALSIMRLLRAANIEARGQVRFQGRNLLELPEREMRRLRGKDISMVFQEPMTSLNPVLTVKRQINETLMLHEGLSWNEATDRSIELLRIVGIPAPERRVRDYPHQLSGGMRQRVMIAIALACSPNLLIADEPTTALDVTIQAQVLELMWQLKKKFRSAVMLITHDLGVVAEVADRVIVMYAGRAVEMADVKNLFKNPRHHYTGGLLNAIPKLGSSLTEGPRQPLYEIPGNVPSLRQNIVGCAFAPRCAAATQVCREIGPTMDELAPRHFAACHHPLDAGLIKVRQ